MCHLLICVCSNQTRYAHQSRGALLCRSGRALLARRPRHRRASATSEPATELLTHAGAPRQLSAPDHAVLASPARGTRDGEEEVLMATTGIRTPPIEAPSGAGPADIAAAKVTRAAYQAFWLLRI